MESYEKKISWKKFFFYIFIFLFLIIFLNIFLWDYFYYIIFIIGLLLFLYVIYFTIKNKKELEKLAIIHWFQILKNQWIPNDFKDFIFFNIWYRKSKNHTIYKSKKFNKEFQIFNYKFDLSHHINDIDNDKDFSSFYNQAVYCIKDKNYKFDHFIINEPKLLSLDIIKNKWKSDDELKVNFEGYKFTSMYRFKWIDENKIRKIFTEEILYFFEEMFLNWKFLSFEFKNDKVLFMIERKELIAKDFIWTLEKFFRIIDKIADNYNRISK